MTSFARAFTIVLAVFAIAASTASAAVIDTFAGDNTPQSEAFTIETSGTDSVDDSSVAGVIGSGDRDASVALNSGSGNITGIMNNDGGLGTAGAYNLEAPITGSGRWVLTYGDDTPLNADLTDGGANAIVVTFVAGDNGANVTITVTTDSTGNADVGAQTLGSPGVGELVFFFNNFTNSGNLDFTDTDKVVVEITGSTGGDYSISFLESTFVPEPATMALLGMGGVGLIGAIRRRRRA